jgi:hypothetical protein
MNSEEQRRIMAQIAADYEFLRDWTLKQHGPLQRQQAIEVLISSPFSAVTPDRESKERQPSAQLSLTFAKFELVINSEIAKAPRIDRRR